MERDLPRSHTTEYMIPRWKYLLSLLTMGEGGGSMYISPTQQGIEMRTSRIVVQTTPEVKELLKTLAEAKHRTMSNLIEMMIIEASAEHEWKCRQNEQAKERDAA